MPKLELHNNKKTTHSHVHHCHRCCRRLPHRTEIFSWHQKELHQQQQIKAIYQ